MGAWIETFRFRKLSVFKQSRPTWARGLKLAIGDWRMAQEVTSRPTWARGLKLDSSCRYSLARASRPTWARGLKLKALGGVAHIDKVAPHVGAWIET